MKIKIAAIVIITMCLGINAQKIITLEGVNDPNFVNNDGKVGIGTTNPSAKLDVRGNIKIGDRMELEENIGSPNAGAIRFGDHTNWKFHFKRHIGTDAGKELMTIVSGSGNVGIGTTNPSGILDVLSKDTNKEIYFSANINGQNQNSNSPRLNFVGQYQKAGYGIQAINVKGYGTKDLVFFSHHASDYTTYKETVRFTHDGNVKTNNGRLVLRDNSLEEWKTNGNAEIAVNFYGYNGLNTQFRDFSVYNGKTEKIIFVKGSTRNVAINGKLESKEIKVTNSPTADFVFDKDYNLPTLKSIEKHIKEKRHLPEIASAKEMEKDGVNIGKFQIQLLQKIEELTLYTIKQNKELKKLQDRISKLEKNRE